MRIAHLQAQCAPGGYETNIQKVLDGLARADAEKVEIISFPECFLTGYFPTSQAQSREHSWSIDGPQITDFLERTAPYRAMCIVGFIERAGDKLYNTVLVAEGGRLLGSYRKVFVCNEFFSTGRDFPVFEKSGVKFGIIICADGGFIEPARILALKGAQIIFAPHWNEIDADGLINHYQMVKADHIARAVENGVWFFHANNVDIEPGQARVAYGESYLLNPLGEVVAAGSRHRECFVVADIDPNEFRIDSPFFQFQHRDRSLDSIKALGRILLETSADITWDTWYRQWHRKDEP